MEVIYVWSLKVDVDVREQDSVSQILLDRFICVPTFIPPDLLERFYDKFCNKQLWPLFHYMLPFSVDHGGRFNSSLWEDYVLVNRLFSQKVMKVISPDAVYVWIHDYYLMVMPTFLRRRFNRSGSGKYSPSWFDMRVFYVRVSNFSVDESTPDILTLHHIPLNPDTHLEVNGWRCSIHSDRVLSFLRRDRVDKQSEEATFVCTDGIRFMDSVKFEVCYRKELLLSGILNMPSCNGSDRELRDSGKLWRLSCETEMVAGAGFLKGNHERGTEYTSPVIEVYVAGSFSGSPVILTETLKLSLRNKHSSKAKLHAIPEHGSSGTCKDAQT